MAATTVPRRVAIVDDHPTIRAGLAARLAIEPDLQVCGEADDIPSALRMIEETSPHIAVVDVTLKNGSGVDLVKRIISRNAAMRILMWSVYPESLYAERALRAGASGYITKDCATEAIVDAIRCVLNGKVYASPALTQQILSRNTSAVASTVAPMDLLSDREMEVFLSIGRGRTTTEIAKDLKLSSNTVETDRSRIRQKLNLSNAAQLHSAATQCVLENG